MFAQIFLKPRKSTTKPPAEIFTIFFAKRKARLLHFLGNARSGVHYFPTAQAEIVLKFCSRMSKIDRSDWKCAPKTAAKVETRRCFGSLNEIGCFSVRSPSVSSSFISVIFTRRNHISIINKIQSGGNLHSLCAL
jgi:hypothetical protein